MTEMTALDTAHAAMTAAPEDDTARMRFYDVLATSELFLLLAAEPGADSIAPEIFDLSDARFVLVFDREDRLTAFTGRAVPYAALSGRGIADMLAGQGIGLGVNLDVAPSSLLLPSEAVDWLARITAQAPDKTEARVAELHPPSGVPEGLLTALDARLAAAVGLAGCAWLARAAYEDGRQGHVLGIAGTRPGAEDALAQSVREALVFSGVEAGGLDVVFLRDSDPLAARLSRVGLRFDIPQPPEPEAPTAPGSDPDRPPILR